MEQKLLSIVMPTFNRSEMLQYTMSLLKGQVIRNAADVELILCDNASTDDTYDVLDALKRKDDYFSLIHYDDHVDIGISITRSIDNATGKYFLLWSDDDVPGPMMVDILLDALKRHKDLTCITFNRIQGYSKLDEFAFHNATLLYKDYPNFEQLYESSQDFVEQRWRGMTFLSADLISMEAWKKGLSIYTKEHLGWEFLAPVLYGISGGRCLFINYPMCIQRWLYKPRYRVKWASYIYVGIPRILTQLQSRNVIRDWKALYSEYLQKGQFNSSWLGYAFNMIYWATQDRAYYEPLIKEINKYQSSGLYKLTTYAIKLPDWIVKPIRVIVQGVLKFVGKSSLL